MLRILATFAALAASGKPSLPVIKADRLEELTTQAQLDAEDKAIDDVGGGDCDCGSWKMSASSTLKAEGKAQYGVENLRDHKLKTAWCEGVAGFGQGQKLSIELDTELGHPGWSGKFRLFNGYQAGEKVWRKNGRVKTLQISVNGTPIARVELSDLQGAQTFSVEPQLPENPRTVTVEIVDVYTAGATAQDTCLSELELDACCP